MEQNGASINDLLLQAEEARKNKDNLSAIQLYRQVLNGFHANSCLQRAHENIQARKSV